MVFQPLPLNRLARPAAVPAATRSALVLPDFDLAVPAAAPVRPAPPSGPTQAEIDALLDLAREAALAEGLAEGERLGREAAARSREAVFDATLITALQGIEAAREGLRRDAAAHAGALSALVLRLVDAALPAASARHAPAALDALLQALGPLEDVPPGAVLRVPPLMLDAARERLAGQPLPVEADAGLASGDARVAWRGGSLAILLDDRRAAINEILRSLDLLDPTASLPSASDIDPPDNLPAEGPDHRGATVSPATAFQEHPA